MEAVATPTGLRIVERKPAAYAPRRKDLTPAQIRWMKDQGWIDRRRVERLREDGR